jgi:peptidyl-tRNA hydrolase, PTH1 family
VGLGNPGPEYDETRHNAGFLLADHLVARWRIGPFRRGDRSREARGTWDDHPVRVLKPQTYMNRSGAALAPLRGLPEFDASRDLLILVDDVALPLGRFRLRGAGSAGGHNGLKSVEHALGTQEYGRLRIGVGPSEERKGIYSDLADFVLSPFAKDERADVVALIPAMEAAALTWVNDGIEKAMNLHNRRPD